MDKVVLFDGVCNLCHGTVQKLIQIDQNNVLKFSSLQSNFGQELLKKLQMPTQHFNSIIYYKEGKVYKESNAVLEILNDVGGLWKITKIFKIIPRRYRDIMYQFVANHRYQWFGKKETCWLPTPELKDKFLN